MVSVDKSAPFAPKRLARLAAVQALYQVAYEQQNAAQIVRDMIADAFISLREESVTTGETEVQPDVPLFTAIVNGVVADEATIDELLKGALDAKFSSSRMEILLRVILRAGVYELIHQQTTPAGVVINDYVDVTRSFFNAKEPGLVNAVLDKLGKKLRA